MRGGSLQRICVRSYYFLASSFLAGAAFASFLSPAAAAAAASSAASLAARETSTAATVDCFGIENLKTFYGDVFNFDSVVEIRPDTSMSIAVSMFFREAVNFQCRTFTNKGTTFGNARTVPTRRSGMFILILRSSAMREKSACRITFQYRVELNFRRIAWKLQTFDVDVNESELRWCTPGRGTGSSARRSELVHFRRTHTQEQDPHLSIVVMIVLPRFALLYPIISTVFIVCVFS